MNEINQEELSRSRAERSNKALRNLSLGAGALVGFGVLFEAVSPAVGALYAVGLGAFGISAHYNLRKIQSAQEQD